LSVEVEVLKKQVYALQQLSM